IAPIDVQIPIEKIVTNQPTATETFTFRLAEVTDATGDTYSSPFVGAVQTINGSGSAAFTIEQLGVGTYYFKITEDNDGLIGWTYDSTSFIVKVEVFNDASNGDGLDYSLLVLNSNLSEVVFSNAYSSTFEQDLGSLTVTKSLSATRPGAITDATAFSFKVLDTASGNYLLFNTAGVCTGTNSLGTTLSVSVNTPAVLTGIPAGLSVRVEELASSGVVAGWTKTVSYLPAANFVVEIDGQHEVAITNSYSFNSGSLTVSKALSATRPGAITDATSFSVRIYEVMSGNYLLFNASGNYTGTDSLGTTLSTSVDTPVTVTGIPAGWQIAVEEVSTSGDVAGWTKTVSYAPAAEVVVVTGGQHQVVVTNSYAMRPDDPAPDDPDPVDPDPDDPVSDDPRPVDPEQRVPNPRGNTSSRGSIPGTGDTTLQLVWIMLALALVATPLMYEGRQRRGRVQKRQQQTQIPGE
ncbi:MAG: DUF5979 domain-containing protein, partial [Coriobacteriales bacterium]|nr:DUF5979 domain-containing protein [Coriobacteriales bacterium]